LQFSPLRFILRDTEVKENRKMRGLRSDCCEKPEKSRFFYFHSTFGLYFIEKTLGGYQ